MPRLTQAHFAARRAQILEATFRCLARKGYSRMTMRDVAAEAGISVGTLYLHFENKDAMVRALSEQRRAQTDAKLAERFPGAGPMEMLGAIVESLIRMLDDPGQAEALRVDVQFWAEALHHESLRALFLTNLAGRIEQLSMLIIEAQQAGTLPEGIHPARLSRIFMAIMMGLELQKAMEPDHSLAPLVDPLQALLGATTSED